MFSNQCFPRPQHPAPGLVLQVFSLSLLVLFWFTWTWRKSGIDPKIVFLSSRTLPKSAWLLQWPRPSPFPLTQWWGKRRWGVMLEADGKDALKYWHSSNNSKEHWPWAMPSFQRTHECSHNYSNPHSKTFLLLTSGLLAPAQAASPFPYSAFLGLLCLRMRPTFLSSLPLSCHCP